MRNKSGNENNFARLNVGWEPMRSDSTTPSMLYEGLLP